MFDLVGFVAIVVVFLITFLIGSRNKDIYIILLVAFFSRILFLIINNYFFYLPDGNMDALNFESRAWRIAQVGFLNVFDYYPGLDAYFISFMYAIPYSLFGRSVLMLQSFSILLGIGCTFLGWLTAKKLWNNHTAIKICWFIAIFPSALSYSVLTMREVYISFFLLLAIFGIVKWVKEKSYTSIILTIFGFVAAAFFHGASIIGLFVFLIILGLDSLKRSFNLIKVKRISLRSIFIIILSSFIILLYFTNKIHVPYLKTFDNTVNLDHMKTLMNVNTKGDASYPEWLKIENNTEFIYKVPIRSAYFLFSPFPWDIKKLSHFVGLFDSFLYLYLTYLIIRNRKVIFEDPALKIILLILLCYFVIFGIGVSNFGTGIRHRVKFAFELILLAGPLIPRFILLKKSRVNTK